jgi:hypothetical protein
VRPHGQVSVPVENQISAGTSKDLAHSCTISERPPGDIVRQRRMMKKHDAA